MLVNPAILLDASMTAAEALARFATNGVWLDPRHPVVAPIIERQAERLSLDFEEVEARLHRSHFMTGAAIRRQRGASIAWYAFISHLVLEECLRAEPAATLAEVLCLDEGSPQRPIEIDDDGEVPEREGVVFDRGTPVAVSLENWGAGPAASADGGLEKTGASDGARSARPTAGGEWDIDVFDLGSARGLEAGSPPPAETREVRAWPRLEAPEFVTAGEPFEVVAGLAIHRQEGVSGGEVVIDAPAGAASVKVSVELIADGFEALSGWSRTMTVAVDDPGSARVEFRLVGLPPRGPHPVSLSTLELRYVYEGAVCGRASRPIVVSPADEEVAAAPLHFGDHWLDQPEEATAVTLVRESVPIDLEIEIAKPDRNPAEGRYVCRLSSPHTMSSPQGPFEIDLGNDAQSFAKELVNQIRSYSKDAIVENLIDSFSLLLGDHLGPDVTAAIREVGEIVSPEPPSVLLVSAEPYVPWELARIDPPLDPAHPPILGAQVRLGRWLKARPSGRAGGPRPPVRPPAQLAMGPMAVMAGYYNRASGRNRLPLAEAEAQELARIYGAIPVEASTTGLKALLDAQLKDRDQQPIGGADLIHFAGHGEYDPSNPDASVLVLSDGQPARSLLFRSAKYGDEHQPMFFLNACMAGIGDQLLGDMGGYPGNCLQGGFGSILGALWEVKDDVAKEVALEFWERALPTAGEEPEPIGEILRDIRGRYAAADAGPPPVSLLAYVYYGHPGLTFRPAAEPAAG